MNKNYIFRKIDTRDGALFLKHDQGKDRVKLSEEMTIFINKDTAERKLKQLLTHYPELKREYFLLEEF